MNKVYKVIWNSRLSCWQAVSELAKGQGSRSQTSGVSSRATATLSHTLSAALLFGMAMLPLSVQAAIQNNALPTGVQVNSGSASFTQTNDTLNINQNSQTLSSNWNTFNIGQDATVNFNQPNQSSVAINHVLDSNASQIMGRLNANGQVFLLNPNGVVFSKTAQVNVGGIVTSTLQLSDSDIQTGKYLLKGDASSNASIENHGSINTLSGGTVALIAPNVINTGSIKTPNGTTHLTAASQVTLALQDGSLTQYQVDEGVLQGLVDNGGAIVANNGAVYLTAQAKDSLSKAVVNHSGIIAANRLVQNAKGEIILLGDMQQGEVVVSGTLTAEGKNGQDGGFIETSAATVKIEQGTKVSTLSDTAQTGTWLIDPTDFTISPGSTLQTNSGMGASTLQDNLSNNNVTLQTVSNGADEGNIHVDAAVSWSAATALTLNAHNDININADITATNDNGKLNLIYGQNTANTNADYHLNNAAKVNLKAGQNFSTKKGSDADKIYQVITSLGNAGSTTGQDLQGIKGNLANNYVLGSNIEASDTVNWNSGAGFDPIGTDYSNRFTGVFDGLGHTISDLTVNRPTSSLVGLFGDSSGVIRNVGLLDASIKGTRDLTGGLVGYNRSGASITNSYVTGAVSGSGNYTGGLAGANQGSITNSYATGAVSGSNYTGGLIGVNYGGITNSYATGAVSGSGDNGGLIGFNQNTITNSYATGKVSGGSNNGGLIGFNQGNITNAYWNTDTSGQTNGVGSGTSGGTGLTTEQMKQEASFVGFDIDDQGGTGKVWRIYEGNSNPLLRSFLTKVDLSTADKTTTYNGQSQTLAQVTGLDSAKLLAEDNSTFINAGTYSTRYYSNQQGYDLVGNRTATLIIDKKALTVTGLNAANKTYDGNTAATLSGGALSGLVGSETVGLSGLSGTFADKNAGTDKIVTVSGATLSDGTGLASNYSISNPTGLTADITKKALTVTANSATKTYNGQQQSVTGFTATGLVNGETASALTQVSASGSGTNAGSYTSRASGTDNNYDLTFKDGSLDIGKAQISQVNGITANNRFFDGTTQATLNTNSAKFDGVFGTDQLVVSTAQGQFEDPQAGSNKTVNITGLSLSGADAANYELTNTTATTRADIYALTPTPNPTPSIRLTADYQQAIQFRREQQPTVTADLGTIGLVEVINGGVNLTGLNTLTGVR